MMSPTSIVNNTSTIGTTTPLTKPKRPLSSYNLFYRFKRQHIIELQSNNANKDQIIQLINQSPGLEDVYSVPKDATTPDEINEIRKANIVNDMKDNLSPRETAKRRHRKNKNAMNGEVGFIELGKLMNASWKTCDEFAKVRNICFISISFGNFSGSFEQIIRNILLISCVLFCSHLMFIILFLDYL